MTDREFIYTMVFAGADAKIERTGELIRCRNCENHGTRTNMCDIWHRHTNGEGYCHRAKAKCKEQKQNAKAVKKGD